MYIISVILYILVEYSMYIISVILYILLNILLSIWEWYCIFYLTYYYLYNRCDTVYPNGYHIIYIGGTVWYFISYWVSFIYNIGVITLGVLLYILLDILFSIHMGYCISYWISYYLYRWDTVYTTGNPIFYTCGIPYILLDILLSIYLGYCISNRISNYLYMWYTVYPTGYPIIYMWDTVYPTEYPIIFLYGILFILLNILLSI